MKKLIFALLMCVPCAAWGATITRYVNTGSTAGGNGTTNATTGDNRAYPSLSAFEAAEQQDLTDNGGDIMVVYCSGTTIDSTPLTINGWTTNTTCRIKIIGDNTTGVWSDSCYTIGRSGTAGPTIAIPQDGTNYNIENIQIKVSTTDSGESMGIQQNSMGGTIVIKNNIFRRDAATGWENSAISITRKDESGIYYIYNNIFYGFRRTNGGHGCALYNSGASTRIIYLYNNTAYNCTKGFESNNTDVIAINNISYGNAEEDYYGTFHNDSTNNLSEDTTAPALGTYYRSKTITFTDATNGDFHLASSDTDAIDKGEDLSGTFTTDIDGTTRSGTWDIGADEYATTPAAFPQILIFQ